jgi:hypothetical protein
MCSSYLIAGTVHSISIRPLLQEIGIHSLLRDTGMHLRIGVLCLEKIPRFLLSRSFMASADEVLQPLCWQC